MLNEDVWPSHFDDSEIDDIIWEEIQHSPSRGDFICYLIHKPQHGKHYDEVRQRLEVLETEDRTPIGYARAVERIRALAETGHPGALFHMGKLAVHGIGMPQDMHVAIEWYRKGAEAGEMRAACNLGWIYQYGFGPIAPDKDEAFRLLSLGAADGVGAAKASIGLMWLTGEGRLADPVQGVDWLRRAFESGYNNAANHLSDAYFTGLYLPRDVEAGHDWLGKAAAAGDERSMAILGHYLVTGSHGKVDVARGLVLLKEAIDKGYVPAYLWIANLYRHGQGVPRDWDIARDWLEKGAEAGNPGCEKGLEEMDAARDSNPAAGKPPLH